MGETTKTTETLPAKRSLVEWAANRWELEPDKLMTVLRSTVLSVGRNETPPTTEEVAMFLAVAKERDLSPFLGQIHAFRTKRGGVQVVVGIDGWVAMVNREPMFDGLQWEDKYDKDGNLVSVTCIMHRKDRSHPIAATERIDECKRDTEPWRKWPHRMLRHKAYIQCARLAFGYSGIVDPDEAERIKEVDAQVIDEKPRRRVRGAEPGPDTFKGAGTADRTEEPPAGPPETPEDEPGESEDIVVPPGLFNDAPPPEDDLDDLEPPDDPDPEPQVEYLTDKNHPVKKRLYAAAGKSGLGLLKDDVRQILQDRFEKNTYSSLTVQEGETLLLHFQVMQAAQEANVPAGYVTERLLEKWEVADLSQADSSVLAELLAEFQAAASD